VDAPTDAAAAKKGETSLPDGPQVRSLIDQARQARLRGDIDEQNRIFDQLVEASRTGFLSQNVELSVSILRQILDLDPRYPRALFTLAEIYRQVNPVWATEYYNRYLRENPNDPAALFGRGTSYLARNAFSLAIRDLKRLIDELDPDNVPAMANLAMALAQKSAEQGNNDEMYRQALEYMSRAVETARRDDNPQSLTMLPDLLYRLAKMNFGYQQAVMQRAGQPDWTAVIGQYDAAIRVSSQMSASAPVNRQFVDQLRACYDGLVEVYHVISERSPNDPQPYIAMAQLSEARMEVEQRRSQILATEYLKRATEVAPNDGALRMILAERGYMKLGMVSEAIVEVDAAIQMDPANAAKYQAVRAKFVATTQPTSSPADTSESPSAPAPTVAQ
jgi:tetratricopeptide (TPR) repeat protein